MKMITKIPTLKPRGAVFLNKPEHDDIAIGRFLVQSGIKLVKHDRVELVYPKQWDAIKNNIPKSTLQFRIKSEPHNLRVYLDIEIHKKLYSFFYDKTVLN